MTEEPTAPRDLHPLLDPTASLPGRHPHQVLLDNIKSKLGELSDLLERVDGRYGAEDLVYRFWHHSFKVYMLQDVTEQIANLLGSLVPDGSPLHPWFLEIVGSGTGIRFELAHNKKWTQHTRPIVEAFFHARFMLEMAVKYGTELSEAPMMLPSGWAALLELYQIR
jgi:hypothetical protein